MSLRAELVEAGAKKLFERDDINPERKPWHEETTEAVLDAILDTLEANADEWTDAAEATTQPNFPLFAECFIAALRDSDTGPS